MAWQAGLGLNWWNMQYDDASLTRLTSIIYLQLYFQFRSLNHNFTAHTYAHNHLQIVPPHPLIMSVHLTKQWNN